MQLHNNRLAEAARVWRMRNLDSIDARILLARDASPDASLIDIAARVGISRNTVHARLKRLREAGALGTPSAPLSAAAAGRPLLAFVTLSVSQPQIDSVYSAIEAIPEVIEAHTTTGDADLMLRVVARDTADLHRITRNLQLAPGVQRRSTVIATTEVITHRMSLLLHGLATGDA